MYERLVLIGGGGHCISVLDSANSMGIFSEIVILDPNIPSGTIIDGSKVVGGDDLLPQLYADGFRQAFLTVGSVLNTKLRRQLFDKAKTAGFDFPNIMDPTAVIADSAVLGNGVFVGKRAVINAGVTIGDQCIVNSGAIVEHRCEVGDFTHVSIGAVICGDTWIENDVFIGANATVIQGLHVGANSFIQAGEVVFKDVG